jgi:ribonucleoside-diphosphate reductase alpha chain
LNTSKDSDKKKGGSEAEVVPGRPVRRRLPATRQSITHKFSVGNHDGYITVGLFEDGTPGELFITMAKEGSTIGGLMDVIGTLTSMGLQYGVPVQVFVEKFSHSRFEPSGWTKNQDIPHAKSVVDYIYRWLGMEFVPGYREANSPRFNGNNGNGHAPQTAPTAESVTKELTSLIETHVNGAGSSNTTAQLANATSPLDVLPESGDSPAVRSKQFARFQSDAPACDNCGSITVRNGNCYLCHNCGASMGCS